MFQITLPNRNKMVKVEKTESGQVKSQESYAEEQVQVAKYKAGA